MTEYSRARLTIFGKVQGVFFRMETLRTAESLAITGWVRNRPDGSVEAVFEGTLESVEKAIQWCRRGPARSRVDEVKVVREKYSGEFGGFNIR